MVKLLFVIQFKPQTSLKKDFSQYLSDKVPTKVNFIYSTKVQYYHIYMERFLVDIKETHLVTVAFRTGQLLIGETVDVNVSPAEVAVASPSDSAL